MAEYHEELHQNIDYLEEVKSISKLLNPRNKGIKKVNSTTLSNLKSQIRQLSLSTSKIPPANCKSVTITIDNLTNKPNSLGAKAKEKIKGKPRKGQLY